MTHQQAVKLSQAVLALAHRHGLVDGQDGGVVVIHTAQRQGGLVAVGLDQDLLFEDGGPSINPLQAIQGGGIDLAQCEELARAGSNLQRRIKDRVGVVYQPFEAVGHRE